MLQIIQSFDLATLTGLYSVRSLEVAQFLISVTEYGSLFTIGGFAAAISAWYMLHKRYADIVGLFVSVAGSGAVIMLLKYTVLRDRPAPYYQAYLENPLFFHLSFPSAHAGLSMALYGYISYLIFQQYPSLFRWFLIIALPLFSVLIAFSRIYLGVHFLSDILVGLLIGCAGVYAGAIARKYLLPFLD